MIQFNNCFGGHSEKETPGPIPNPEVKLLSADGTAAGTLWETRTPPDFFQNPPNFVRGVLCFPGVLSCWVGRHGGGCLVLLGGWWVVADSRVGTDQNPTLADFRELVRRAPPAGWLCV